MDSPQATVLSVTRVVACCGCPREMRVSLIGMMSWVVLKNEEYSSSVTDVTTFWIILHWLFIPGLDGGFLLCFFLLDICVIP